MKAETIHEHAKRIHSLYDHQCEIARSEGMAFEDYTARDLVLTAKSILEVMEDWTSAAHCDQKYKRSQQQKLRNFVKKWEPTT